MYKNSIIPLFGAQSLEYELLWAGRPNKPDSPTLRVRCLVSRVLVSATPPPLCNPAPLGAQHRALSWAPCVTEQLPTSYLFQHGDICVSILPFQFIPLFPSPATSTSKTVSFNCGWVLEFLRGITEAKSTLCSVKWSKIASNPQISVA